MISGTTLTVHPDESALDLFRRVRCRPLLTGIAFLDQVRYLVSGDGIRLGDVVEIYGPSGCGKSEALINIVARYIMPRELGGEEKMAIFFDNESRLSTLRLELLLKERIKGSAAFLAGALPSRRANGSGREGACLSNYTFPDSDFAPFEQALALDCLTRLKVVRPATSMEFIASLEVLRYELQHSMALLAVDGMGSFYWQDKMAQSCGGDAVSLQGAVARALARFVKERPVVLFAAKMGESQSWGLGADAVTSDRQSYSPGPPDHREYLPQIWQRAVTYRVVLQRQKRSRGGLPVQGGRGGGAGGAFSFFMAKVTHPNRKGSVRDLAGGWGGGTRGGGGSGGGVGGENIGSRDDFWTFHFVVTDSGIHHLPSVAAASGSGDSSI
ncbi:unnamed protein product [Discosporangium mesarthrocarpum]